MPSRILREGILTSERIARLGWAEEVFYRRLMSVVDDYGRYYATPMLLRAACYPLHLGKVSDADIGKWLRCAEKAGLVSVYRSLDGKRYLQLLDFRQQVRAKDSRYPAQNQQAPSGCVADAKQVQASVHLDVDVDVDVIEDDKSHAPVGADLFPGIGKQIVSDFKALRVRKKAPITRTAIAGIQREADKAGLTLESVLSMCCERGWGGFKAEWVAGDRADGAPLPRLQS
jgi:hypothetical protein